MNAASLDIMSLLLIKGALTQEIVVSFYTQPHGLANTWTAFVIFWKESTLTWNESSTIEHNVMSSSKRTSYKKGTDPTSEYSNQYNLLFELKVNLVGLSEQLEVFVEDKVVRSVYGCAQLSIYWRLQPIDKQQYLDLNIGLHSLKDRCWHFLSRPQVSRLVNFYPT